MGGKLSGLGSALYDSKRREFLGRDGGRWAKLSTFYFFFYLGLAGFFCSMLAGFMALSPRDRPTYYSEESRMRTRSNPLSPGLGFRPQPEETKNLIALDTEANDHGKNIYVKNLDNYLSVYYWKKDNITKVDNDKPSGIKKFSISNPRSCNSEDQYGYLNGKPCVLVKMNKLVGFTPKPGYQLEDKTPFELAACPRNSEAISVHCYGEYPADVDNIGDILYISENDHNQQCGSLETDWFPYEGKQDRVDVYQAPYIWAQFLNPKPNVLINVICRVFAENIYFDKKSALGLTRFQLYIKSLPKRASSSAADEIEKSQLTNVA